VKLAVVTGRKEHAALINAAWQKGVDAVIETGLRIIDARDGLEHGEFEAMVQNNLHFSARTVQRLIAIASAYAGKSASARGLKASPRPEVRPEGAVLQRIRNSSRQGRRRNLV
jgi:hypothetical protein